MPLYHFDVVGRDSVFATESRDLATVKEAGDHAVSLALQMMEAPGARDEDGGAIVADAYTAEDGLVLTVRLIVSVDIKAARL